MKVSCEFSLESPHNIPFSIHIDKKRKSPYPTSAAMGFFPKDPMRNSVNEPSVFKPLRFYCITDYVHLIVVFY